MLRKQANTGASSSAFAVEDARAGDEVRPKNAAVAAPAANPTDAAAAAQVHGDDDTDFAIQDPSLMLGVRTCVCGRAEKTVTACRVGRVRANMVSLAALSLNREAWQTLAQLFRRFWPFWLPCSCSVLAPQCPWPRLGARLQSSMRLW